MTSDSLFLSHDVRVLLWMFFGESFEDAEAMAASWPSLPASALDRDTQVPGGSVRIRLDTPFGRAFSTWRKERQETEYQEVVKTLILNGGVEGTIFGVSLTTDPPEKQGHTPFWNEGYCCAVCKLTTWPGDTSPCMGRQP